MRALRTFWNQLYDLVVTTVVVWWRLLPKLLLIQVLSWSTFALMQHLGAIASVLSIWVSIVLLAIGFVSLLIGYVVSLRLVGHELQIDSLVPPVQPDPTRADPGQQDLGGPDPGRQDQNGQDPSQQPTPKAAAAQGSVVDLLAATLLPFLGIYGVFQYVQSEAGQMFILADVMHGGIFSDVDLLGPIDPTRGPVAMATVLGVLVGIYVVRRGLDLLHGRFGLPVLGLAAAFLEATFLLVIIFGGTRVIGLFRTWWEERAFHDWINLAIQGLATSLEPLRIDLPAVLRQLAGLLGQLWTFLLDGTVEPLLWLAVAALVFGTHVLSLAELWRKGQPLSAQVVPPSLRHRVHRDSDRRDRGILRRVWLEVQEAAFGDIDDRYLPTLQSIRLVLKPGLTFLAAYLIVYAVVNKLSDAAFELMIILTGGQEFTEWMAILPFLGLASAMVYQPVFMVLLAVTFHRCLLTLRGMANRAPAVIKFDPADRELTGVQ